VCRREEKKVVANKIVGLVGLNFFFLGILSELKFKCNKVC
jgi:hypothetical protein